MSRSSPADAAVEDDGIPLLTTKLFAPRPRSEMVMRPRLQELMTRGSGRCTLLSAPAGAGKTTLLAAWLHGRAAPVAWLSLDERDQDVHLFLRYVVAALQTVAPACGTTALGWLTGQRAAPEVVITTLLNDMAGLPDGTVLVLDDYHVIRSAPVHSAVGFLIDHLPHTVRLVMATREDPPFPLARMRGRGELVEVRAADLGFDVDEACGLLVGGMRLPLDRTQVAALVDRTEGWAAGLQLAGLAIRAQPDPAAFVAAFAGSHRLVADFLTAEVLERQPPDAQRFLLTTGLLDRMCAPLCAAVLGIDEDDARRILDDLDRANLFVVPLDDNRTWFRYHHLFADVLRSRVTAEARREGHRRAGAWCSSAGLLPEAIDHALAAGDAAAAAARIEAMLPLLFGRVDLHDAVRSWLVALPDEHVRAHPVLCLALAWIMINRFDLVEAITWTEAAARALPGPRTGRVFGAVAAMQAFLGPHRALPPEQVLATAESALRELGPDDAAFGVAAGIGLGQSLYALDRPALAEQAFADAAAVGWGGGLVHSAMIATSYQIWVQRAVGARRRALRTCRAAMERLTRSGAAPPSFGLLTLQLADLECDGTDLPTAARLAAEGFALLRTLPEPGLMLMLAVQSTVRVSLASGDVDAAEAALAEVVTLAGSGPTADLARLITAGQARVWLARGEVAAAVAWLDGEPGPWQEFFRFGPHVYRAAVQVVCLTPALILLRHAQETGDTTPLHRAAERLEHARSFTDQECLRSLRIDRLVLDALVRERLGDRSGALEALTAAAAQAAPEGIVRPFVDLGAPMAALLDAARTATPSADLDVLRAAFPDPGAIVRRPVARTALVEPLTLRERDVVRLLAQGRSNADIARALFVGESTVKTHLGSVYRKLGVRGRTHALARVRELGLVE